MYICDTGIAKIQILHILQRQEGNIRETVLIGNQDAQVFCLFQWTQIIDAVCFDGDVLQLWHIGQSMNIRNPVKTDAQTAQLGIGALFQRCEITQHIPGKIQ